MHSEFDNFRPRAWAATVLFALIAWTSPAWSRPQPLTAKQAVRAALDQSPELVGRRLAVAAGQASVTVAEQTRAAAPVADVEGGLRRNAAGDSSPEVTLAVTQPVRLSSLAGDRKAHARASVALLQSERAEAELDVALLVLQAWLELEHWERVAKNRESAVVVAEQLAQTVAARVRIGAGRPGDDALAESMLGRTRAMQLAAQAEVRSSIGELQLLLDLPPSLDLVTDGEFRPPQASASALHPSEAVLSARATERRHLAQLELTQARAPLGLGVSVTREGTGDWLMLARVSVPLTSANPASYAAAQTRREIDVLEFEARHMRERLGRLETQARDRERLQLQIVEQIRAREVEPAKRALAVLNHQFSAAKVPLSELIVARERLNDAELHLFEAHHELELQRARRAWLSGQLVNWARSER